jgi:hypothetical protein
MNTEVRYLGGPAPDGEYFLAMIDGRSRYRVSGYRGTTAYLGFQVLAGIGLTPRRMGAYVSDRGLELTDDGRFGFVLAAEEPTEEDLAGDPWVPIPDDSSAIVVREYIADRAKGALGPTRHRVTRYLGATDSADGRVLGRAADLHGVDHRQVGDPLQDD